MFTAILVPFQGCGNLLLINRNRSPRSDGSLAILINTRRNKWWAGRWSAVKIGARAAIVRMGPTASKLRGNLCDLSLYVTVGTWMA